MTPFEGISSQAKDVKYTEGCAGYKALPLISEATKTSDGKPGLTMKCYAVPPLEEDRKVLQEVYCRSSEMMMFDFLPKGITSVPALWYGDITGTLTPERSCKYNFSLMVAGTAKIYIDDKLVVDNATKLFRPRHC